MAFFLTFYFFLKQRNKQTRNYDVIAACTSAPDDIIIIFYNLTLLMPWVGDQGIN